MTARRMGSGGIPFAPRTKSVNRFKATGKKQKTPATLKRGSYIRGPMRVIPTAFYS